MSEDTQLWEERDWVKAMFTDPVTGKVHPVTITGYSALSGDRSLVMFAGGHKQWVARSDVKR